MTREFQKGTIKELQNYVESKIKQRGFNDESLQESLLLLTEEVGELIKACRHETEMNVEVGKERPHTPGQEVADVLNMLFAVGIKLGIDVEKEFLEKERIIDERAYERAKKK